MTMQEQAGRQGVSTAGITGISFKMEESLFVGIVCLLACLLVLGLLVYYKKQKTGANTWKKKKAVCFFFFFVARRLGRYRQSVKVGGGRRDVAFENSNSEKTRITGKLEKDLSDP